MKAIILAGGAGSRLSPVTRAVNKHLLPVFDKPMIYYPLSTVMLAGIREVLLITRPEDRALFSSLLGNGEQWGMRIEYAVQPKASGIPEAFLIAEDFLAGSAACLHLGDNLFYSEGLTQTLIRSSELKQGARVFGYWVSDPERYGVLDLDEDERVRGLVEKPKQPPSSYAVPGIYFVDHTAVQRARSLKPSARGETEIVDLLKGYLQDNKLEVELLGRGVAWLDTGTSPALLSAAQFIEVVQSRQGLLIGSPDEVAYRKGFISLEQLKENASRLGDTEYSRSLIRIMSWLTRKKR
jgi:glucose-1-phosphate thymidylyltransferase